MDMKEIQELAKAAAHTAVTATGALSEISAVDKFLNAYEYAIKQIVQKQRQSQSEVNMEFGSNEAKFR